MLWIEENLIKTLVHCKYFPPQFLQPFSIVISPEVTASVPLFWSNIIHGYKYKYYNTFIYVLQVSSFVLLASADVYNLGSKVPVSLA